MCAAGLVPGDPSGPQHPPARSSPEAPLTSGAATVGGLGVEVCRAAARPSGSSSGRSAGGGTAAGLLECRLAGPFRSAGVPASRLLPGPPSARRWPCSLPAVPSSAGWPQGAASRAWPKQASSAEQGNGCIAAGGLQSRREPGSPGGRGLRRHMARAPRRPSLCLKTDVQEAAGSLPGHSGASPAFRRVQAGDLALSLP